MTIKSISKLPADQQAGAVRAVINLTFHPEQTPQPTEEAPLDAYNAAVLESFGSLLEDDGEGMAVPKIGTIVTELRQGIADLKAAAIEGGYDWISKDLDQIESELNDTYQITTTEPTESTEVDG